MYRTWVAVGVLVLVVATVLAGGYRLHALNRARTIEQFEELEQHTSSALAALLQNDLTGAAHTVQTLADAAPERADSRLVDNLLEDQIRCTETPCFMAVAVYAGERVVRSWGRRPVDLPAPLLQQALAWSRDPAHARHVLPLISSPQPPSLVLVSAVDGGSPRTAAPPRMIAAQIDLDSLFAVQQRTPGPGWRRYRVLAMKTDGTVVFHSEHPEMRLNNVYRRTPRCQMCHDSFAHVERMLAMQHGVLEYRSGGSDEIAAVAPLTFEGERWIVAVEVARDDVTGLLSAQMWQTLALGTGVFLLVAAAGVLTWRDGQRRFRAEAAAREKANLEESHAQLTALNRKLEGAAHEWRTTADTIDAALMVIEPDGAILRMNRVAAATLPETLMSWLGRSSAQIAGFSPWHTALALAHEAAQRGVVTTGRTGDADGRSWELWCRPLGGLHVRPAVVVLARDVTELAQLQESVRRAETMAALGSIVVGVAHEVRNPLFAISSLVDAWALQPHRDPRPFVDALRGEVERLRTLMVELLEYGKPSAARLEPRPLRAVVEAAIQACAHEAVARHVEVVCRGTADGVVAMDARRLERVFINVVQNAVQHAPTDSHVHVDVTASTMPGGPAIEIRVRDHGPGFAPDDLPKIFTPFFSRRPGGFGLGLAITERIVSEHQGTIAAGNDSDRGAVIVVTLPLAGMRAAGTRPIEGELAC